MSIIIHPIFDDGEDNPLIWLGKIAVAVTVGAVLSHFGVLRLSDNIKF